MKGMLWISFFLLLTAIGIMFQLSPGNLFSQLRSLFEKKPTLAVRIKRANEPRPTGLRKLMGDIKELMRISGTADQFTTLCTVSLVLFTAGALAGIALRNAMLIPTLAVALGAAPFCIVLLAGNRYKKQMNAELETALSLITTSYLRTEDIVQAIEENISTLNPPVQDVFSEFLAGSNYINANLKLALAALIPKIPNPIFAEWIHALLAAQDNHKLKHNLTGIVAKLADVRDVNAELEYLLYQPIKEYITLLCLLLLTLPLFFFLNRKWFDVLLFTTPGKVVLGCTGIVILVTGVLVAYAARPLDYRR